MQTPRARLILPDLVLGRFTNGQERVAVIVNLVPPPRALQPTDWKSARSLQPLTRAALSTGGRAKSKFSSVSVGDTIEVIKLVLPLLEKYGVQAYFWGHDNVLEHLVHEPINFCVCGGGSQHRILNQRVDLRFGAESAGFLAMTLTGTSAEARFISDQGKESYLTKITLP